MTLFDYLDKHPIWSLVFIGVGACALATVVEAFGKWRRR